MVYFFIVLCFFSEEIAEILDYCILRYYIHFHKFTSSLIQPLYLSLFFRFLNYIQKVHFVQHDVLFVERIR